MAGHWRTLMSRAFVTLLASFLVVACSPSVGGPTAPAAVCDGIPADMGGCSSTRPTFVGSTCEELAGEWGRYVDQHVVAVIEGPDEAAGKQRSVRISDVLVLASIVVGMRLNELNLLAECDVTEFLPVAKGQFSDQLTGDIGAALFDGNPIASTRDWDAVLERAIGIIDEGE